jgi:hypothetical protein
MSLAMRCMRLRVSNLTLGLFARARETVDSVTPATRAMSFIETGTFTSRQTKCRNIPAG